MQFGDGHAPLVPLSETEFLERKFFGHVAFTKDAQGNVAGLTCRYGNQTFTARRLPGN
jgi:hypothetical protein